MYACAACKGILLSCVRAGKHSGVVDSMWADNAEQQLYDQSRSRDCKAEMDQWCQAHCVQDCEPFSTHTCGGAVVWWTPSGEHSTSCVPASIANASSLHKCFCGDRCRHPHGVVKSRERLGIEQTYTTCKRARALFHLAGKAVQPQCGLIVLPHVPKTGGSTIVDIMHNLPNWTYPAGDKQMRSTVLSVLNEVKDFDQLNHSQRQTRTFRFLSKRYILHFNDFKTTYLFHVHMAPNLAKIRSVYAAAGCSMQVGIALREPSAQVYSTYKFFRLKDWRHVPHWSPIRHNETAQQDDFGAWLQTTSNPQVAWLTNQHCTDALGCNVVPASACEQHLERAHHLLDQADVLATTNSVESFAWALLARVGIFLQPHFKASGAAPGCASIRCNNLQTVGQDVLLSMSTLPADYAELLKVHTECDRAVYARAVERERIELAFTRELVSLLGRSDEALGLASQRQTSLIPPPPLSANASVVNAALQALATEGPAAGGAQQLLEAATPLAYSFECHV